MNTNFRAQLDRIRRRAWLVLAITVAAVAAALATALTEGTVYTAKSTLTVTSQDRAPEQDAVLARGYADYFNDAPYQAQLLASAKVPPGNTFSARTVAASPIVFIEAAGRDRDAALSAVAKVAQAFRKEVNANRRANRQHSINSLQAELKREHDVLDALPDGDPRSQLSIQSILGLQDRISQLRAETPDELQVLQLNAGVAEYSPDVLQNALLALLGGLVLGCVGALTLAAAENRLYTKQDVEEQLKLPTLVHIKAGRTRGSLRSYEQQLKRLGIISGLASLPRPAIVAIVAPRETTATAQVAEALAAYRAMQGDRTLLIKADLRQIKQSHDSAEQDTIGTSTYLASPTSSPITRYLSAGVVPNMYVMDAGPRYDDPYPLFSGSRLFHLLFHARSFADLVVVEGSPVTGAAEAQVICARADRTLLVIEQGTRARVAIEARDLLQQVEADVLGTVLIKPRRRRPITDRVDDDESADSPEEKSADTAPAGDETSPAQNDPGAPVGQSSPI